MTKLVLHTSPSVFPNPQRVRLMMHEKGIADAVEERILKMAPVGEQRGWRHLKRNPWGETPTLELPDGGYLAESTAIARYLDASFPGRKIMGETPAEVGQDTMWDARIWVQILYRITTMFHVLHQGLGLKLIGTAERVGADALSVREFPAFLYPGHPLASVNGPFNAVTVESAAITEITMSGPGAGGPQTASAVLGDMISAMIPPASTPPASESLRIVSDVESSFYLSLEVADELGVLSAVARVLGDHGVSVKSVLQEGSGGQARLVMVVHPIAEDRFSAALAAVAALPAVRARPRAIRGVEEEFNGWPRGSG